MSHAKKTSAAKQKAKCDNKRATDSTAISMTYSEYLKEYPHGRKDDSAKRNAGGYAIIDNSDKSNVTWLSDKAFNLINRAFSLLTKSGRKG